MSLLRLLRLEQVSDVSVKTQPPCPDGPASPVGPVNKEILLLQFLQASFRHFRVAVSPVPYTFCPDGPASPVGPGLTHPGPSAYFQHPSKGATLGAFALVSRILAKNKE